MYKPPYAIQPSSFDFFADKLHGTGKWTLQTLKREFDSSFYDVESCVNTYNFYWYVGKEVQNIASVLQRDSTLIKPEEYVITPYKKKVFPKPYPDEASVDALLVDEAKKTIRTSLFGNAEKKRQLYVIEHRGERLDYEQKKWVEEKDAFEEEENRLELEHIEHEKAVYEAVHKKRTEYDRIHDANELFLYSSQEDVERLLQSVNPFFPYDFNMLYQVDFAHKLVNISFEAPSDRIIPLNKQVKNSRGISIIPKGRTEINRDYLDCVCGLAYVIAAQCFNLTAKIENVFISAFVRELDNNTASFKEKTLYSIVFDRETFNWVIKPESFLPYESLVYFPHSIQLGYLLSIVPVDPLDLVPAGEISVVNNQFTDSSRFDSRFDSSFCGLKNRNDLLSDDKAFYRLVYEVTKQIVKAQSCMPSDIIRSFGLGYAKSSRILDILEHAEIIGPGNAIQSREVLVTDYSEAERRITKELAFLDSIQGSILDYGGSRTIRKTWPEVGGSFEDRFEEAARTVVLNQKASTLDLQRRLGMGYAKTCRVLDQLEAAGIVGPQDGTKPREVLVKDLSQLEEILARIVR